MECMNTDIPLEKLWRNSCYIRGTYVKLLLRVYRISCMNVSAETRTILSTQPQAQAATMWHHHRRCQQEAWAVELATLVCARRAHSTVEILGHVSTHMSSQYDGHARPALMTDTGTQESQILGTPSELANADFLTKERPLELDHTQEIPDQ